MNLQNKTSNAARRQQTNTEFFRFNCVNNLNLYEIFDEFIAFIFHLTIIICVYV